MKGIILASDLGARLYPLTRVKKEGVVEVCNTAGK